MEIDLFQETAAKFGDLAPVTTIGEQIKTTTNSYKILNGTKQKRIFLRCGKTRK